jgi:two-component system response regulator HydG
MCIRSMARSNPSKTAPRILVVDDDPLCRRMLERLLVPEGYVVSAADGVARAIEILREQPIDVVLTDLAMPEADGLVLVRHVASTHPDVPTIVMTGVGGVAQSVEALHAGAFWYLEKPFDHMLASLHQLLGQALDPARKRSVERARQKVSTSTETRPRLIGHTAALRHVIQTAERVAPSGATVLITGESGTGKELMAQLIHVASRRHAGPFVPLNCGAIPEELLESELFGHMRGAFTNAYQAREGRFARADGGTIFLDEIGDMSLTLQPKLLRVLQDGTFEPVGGTTQRVDVRVVAATNQDLEQAIADHKFRRDLFFRLNVVPIRMPSLRERTDDIPELADYFLGREAERQDRKPPKLSAGALERLCAYAWPGNVRELQNIMERLVILTDKDVIDAWDLSPLCSHQVSPPAAAIGPSMMPHLPPDGIRFQEELTRLSDELISQALERTGGNKTHAAKLLGLNRTTLLEMLKRRVEAPPDRARPLRKSALPASHPHRGSREGGQSSRS